MFLSLIIPPDAFLCPPPLKYFFANILPRFKHPVVLITLETDGFTMQDNYLKSDLPTVQYPKY